MKIAAIILAAGNSQRFVGIKQLAEVYGRPLLQHVVSQYQQSVIDDIWVVLGANAEAIQAQLPSTIRQIVIHDWQQGMGGSLASAVRQLPLADYSHVMVGLGDHIALTARDINRYVMAAQQQPTHIIATDYPSSAGVPAIFHQSDLDALRQLNGDRGAKALLQQNSHRLTPLECANARVDIDTRQQLQQWLLAN